MRSICLTEIPGAGLLHSWRQFLTRADFATQYVSPDFFVDPFVRGDRFAILAVDEFDAVRAVLTGVTGPGTITSGLPTRPQMAFEAGNNDPVVVSTLLNGLESFSDNVQLTDVYSWKPLTGAVFARFNGRQDVPGNEVVMLDLSCGEDALFAGFSQTRRNEIRKAQKQKALEIKTLDTHEELKDLYEIHVGWSERKGNEPESFEAFKAAMEQTDSRLTVVAKHEGKVVAGSFFRFCKGGVVEYAANNSLVDYQKYRPNDLICWHAIQWACRNEFKYFSMGGAHLFLKRFGGTVMRTHRYRKDLTLFKHHEKREKVLEAISATKRMLPPQVHGLLKPLFGASN